MAIVYYLSWLGKGGFNKAILFLIPAALSFGIAGYLINDWADIKENSAQGRTNTMASFNVFGRWMIVCSLLGLGSFLWYYIYMDMIVITLLSIQIVCYFVYSFPPFRLKEKGGGGLIADAVYAHVLPAMLVIYAFAKVYAIPETIHAYVWLILIFYYGIIGVRNILMHQAKDFEADLNAGTVTYVGIKGIRKAEILKNRVLVPLEFTITALLYYCLPGLRPLSIIFLIYAVYVFFREVSHLRSLVMSGEKINYREYDFLSGILLNEFYEKWLPLLFLAIYMSQVPCFKIFFIAHLIVFLPNTILFYNDYRFGFLVILLPLKLAWGFIYHRGILKTLTLIYFHTKHIIYWYVYSPVKKILARS